MTRTSCIIVSLIFCTQVIAQQNRIKLGFIGVPLQSGCGMANAGYERLDKNLNKSWQFLFSAAAGTIALDAPGDQRLWITIERVNYFGNIDKKTRPYFSYFIEAGTRKTTPGWIKDPPGRSLRFQKSFEIDPGIAVGASSRIGKRLGIETAVGPKWIFSKGRSYYHNSLTGEDSNTQFSESVLGSRFFFSFFYQF